MNSPLRIIVTGLIAQHPTLGGVTWDYLQYVLGLARLGHDVYYFEDSGQWPYTIDGGPSGNNWTAYDPTPNVTHLANIMSRYGLANRWAYRFPVKSQWFGLTPKKRREVVASADLLINVSGALIRPADYRQVRRLVYIDSDPVFTQVKLTLPRGQLKFRKRVEAHDVHFSFGERFSENVPVTGHRWHPTRTPIVLSEWRSSPRPRDRFTTVMNWTSYKPLEYEGRNYGQKDIEFKRFLELPARVKPAKLEVALGTVGLKHHWHWQTEGEDLPPVIRTLLMAQPDLSPPDLLRQTGWYFVDPQHACGNFDSYRDYIESSKAEWSVAKNGFVVGQSGWFSCRSACYLAAGRPVVVQDTGFSPVIPAGEGVLAFSTLEEAVAAIYEVEGNYARHARAARAIAEEFFDSNKVLTRLVSEAMNAAPEPFAQEVLR